MSIKQSCLLLFFTIFIFSILLGSEGRPGYWQQEVGYLIEVDFNHNNHKFTGKQEVTLINHSPDQLDRVYFHLYYNAFQPGSMMDMRSTNIEDPDGRVGNRISRLRPNEVGYHNIKKITMDGQECEFLVTETIMDVFIPFLINPGDTVVFYLEYEAQVPLQIRRTGRMSEEGIAYSMAQWYPKLAQYDEDGWHAHPYVGREFYGIFGDFDVIINIDSSFTVAAGGVLQNPHEIGHGYTETYIPRYDDRGRLTWHFRAENVHDFAWAADTGYTHVVHMSEHGTVLRFFYLPSEIRDHNWGLLPDIVDAGLTYLVERCGDYPYPEFVTIQAADGGMEYPMATFITGHRPLLSLAGVTIHELIHMWYYLILATNETVFPYMDEGFTTYMTQETMNHLAGLGLLPGREWQTNPHTSRIENYTNFAREGREEPMSTFADHYLTNAAYWMATYTKASVMLVQLSYIIGQEAFDKTLLEFYDRWNFKHPKPDDYFRIAEEVSGLNLKWYQNLFINTTNTIDYGIDTLMGNPDGTSSLILVNNGSMPMPVDLTVYVEGNPHYVTIPLVIMHGSKEVDGGLEYMQMEPWRWTSPMYEMQLPFPIDRISSVVIDESGRLADINREDNVFPRRR